MKMGNFISNQIIITMLTSLRFGFWCLNHALNPARKQLPAIFLTVIREVEILSAFFKGSTLKFPPGK